MTIADRTWTQSVSEYQRQPNGRRQQQQQRSGSPINVGGSERAVSIAAGSLLAALGISRKSLPGLLIAGVGADLIYRGATGHCHLYQAMGVNTAQQETAKPEDYFERGIHVEQSYLINKPRGELYQYWRNFENLPRIMSHLQSVQVIDDRRSHWVAKAPSIAGGKVEWDTEIINDEPNSVIAWRSLPGADVDNAGSIRFMDRTHDRGTQVSVVIDYIPPAGRVGKWISMLFGEAPEQQIQEDLRRFKRIMETGEIPTIQGQPKGACGGSGQRQQGW